MCVNAWSPDSGCVHAETFEERNPPWQIAYFEVADSER